MERRWTGKVFIATSLDGFIARPDGELDFLSSDPAAGQHAPGHPELPEDFGYAEHMAGVGHVVMGRGTYEKVLTFDHWPYPDKRVIVISRTAETGAENITIVRSLDEAVARLEDEGAQGVYVDGGATVRAFLAAGLIDSIVLTRVPFLIGQGIPLFGDLGGDVQLIHEGTVASGNGFVQSRYRVLHD